MKAKFIFFLAMVFVLVGCARALEERLRAEELSRAEREAQRKAEVAPLRMKPAPLHMKPTQVSWRAPGKTRILSIGIGNFKDTAIQKVKYAAADAKALASLARSSGVPKENITCLTNEKSFRNDITQALVRLKTATTEESETAIFYFPVMGRL